jgi:hypothetical protein
MNGSATGKMMPDAKQHSIQWETNGAWNWGHGWNGIKGVYLFSQKKLSLEKDSEMALCL